MLESLDPAIGHFPSPKCGLETYIHGGCSNPLTLAYGIRTITVTKATWEASDTILPFWPRKLNQKQYCGPGRMAEVSTSLKT